MADQFSRTRMLLGDGGMERLFRARVAVFGLGGVGGHAAEALARSGVGSLDLIDSDTVTLSNLNRQIVALHSTLGMYKADAARDRILDINPEARVRALRVFYGPDTADQFDFRSYDYIVDAIDTVSGKTALAVQAREAGVPIISCMGAGNRISPAGFQVADIYSTEMCPLARVMRKELRKRGIPSLKVVYSPEPALVPGPCGEDTRRRKVPGSSAFAPAAAGLLAAAEVVKDLTDPGSGRSAGT